MSRIGFADVVIDTSGNALSNVTINVYLQGTTTAATIYTLSSGGSTKSNPFSTSTDGMIAFFVDPGSYDVKLTDGNAPARFSTRTVQFDAVSGADLGIDAAQLPLNIIPAGVVSDFAGSSAPTGWLLCDGSAVSRSTYSALFSAIGTTHGTGDGSTTFNVPDCRGRMSIGAGTGSGLTARTLATKSGSETHTLTSSELPVQAIVTSGGSFFATFVEGSGADVQTANGNSHNIMNPNIVLNKIIKI